MSRPQIVVNVSAALARRGNESPTGRAFILYAAAAGNTEPVRCLSAADATATLAPSPIPLYVGDALNQGAPDVILLRAVASNPAAVTQAEWETALGKLDDSYGMGQVLIPGIDTAAAYAALLAHSTATGRTVFLDSVASPTATALATTVAGLALATSAGRAGMFAPWVTLPAAGGATRNVPGSVIAAGLAARGDAIVGHTNHAPAGDQGRGAGKVKDGITVTKSFTNAELDTLYDGGVNVFRNIGGEPTLYGWTSISTDNRFQQLNAGRTAMLLGDGIQSAAQKFLFRQIDGRGLLFAELEGALRGYLAPLWASNALYGETADEAFDVDVAAVNTPATTAAGELRASVGVSLTPHAEKVTIDVVTNIAQGV